MNSARKSAITLIVVAVGYVLAVIVGTGGASNSSSMTTLTVENGGSRCEYDNVYIGDGALRIHKHCSRFDQEGQSNAQD
ncbi:hypothetical protein [Burkholderia sp. AU16741]|uniref:hypothetical protein n=1 Tax=Burkholderia sp. AU16741 TaxID=2015347 RepID=UPI00117E4766|nr:hypothetical protein [Burkholderia sp. AU16741]